MINKHLLASALCLSVGFAATAQADDEFLDDRFYVAPFGSYVKPGGDRNSNSDSGWGGGLGFGKIIDKHFNVEVRGFYNNFDDETVRPFGQNSGDWDLMGGTADLQYYFTRDTFAPYTVIGVGGMNSNVNGNSGVGILGEAGAGFTYELHDNFLLRSDVRYRYNNNFNAHLTANGTDEYHDMVVNVGFVVPLGPKPKAAAPEPAAPDCSTLDSDSDGVNDCLDQCPGTISGSKVDEKGCALSVELKGVTFEYNSARLTPNATTILDTVAESLVAYPQKEEIEVQGHTSSEGSKRYNQRLSEKRAQSVVDYLGMKGVTNRLSAHGFGEEMPIADNSTEEGKQQNRRVELHWLQGAPAPVTTPGQ
jgi:OmpA-OmpF porin, OOP family